MHNHSPKGYVCPFCLLIKGVKNKYVYSVKTDIIYQDNKIIAFVSSHQYPNNLGNVIVIPNTHIENVYDLPDEYISPIYRIVNMLAVAMKKAFNCDGISVRQNNEPAGNQDVWHYHVHVLPRYYGDDLCNLERKLVPEVKRKILADKLRGSLEEIDSLKRNAQ